ncbi:MAG: MATE family efflux transporter [Treponemataceae bacterium]|nr:MATE family efflux transporter [Treponemataceae bacterium]
MKLYKKDPAFYRNVFTLALPIALQSLITIGVNMLDTLMVGSLGENSLSATSLANSFISIYHIFCMGLGMGASVLVSRYWGMKKVASPNTAEQASLALKQTVCLMLRLTILLAALFAVATLIIPGRIMLLYTDDAEIIHQGELYFRWSVLTYFFLGLSLVSTIVLRNVGQVRLPLFVSIGALSINLVANYALIFGHFGLPRMGVAGAALATLIARIFETCAICGYLLFKDSRIQFRLKDIFMKTGSLLREYMRISIPVLISDGILAIGNNSVAMVIGRMGATFVAANAITSVTQQLSTVVISGVSQAGAIVTGQTLGMGSREKTMQQGYQFFGLGIALGLLSGLFILAVSGPVIYSYKNLSAETLEIAKELMLSISFIVVFFAINSIMTKGVLRGGGDTKMLMLADNIFLWILAIPLGILAGPVLHVPAFWVYAALKSDQIVKTVWCAIRLRSGKWIKKISTGQQKEE